MKPRLTLLVLAITISTSAFAQEPAPRPDSPPPPSTSSRPPLPVPPIDELSNQDKEGQQPGRTIEQLPPVTQAEVFAHLEETLGIVPAMDEGMKGGAAGAGGFPKPANGPPTDGTVILGQSEETFSQRLRRARGDYYKLVRRRGKPLSKLLLWTLKGDIYLITYAAKSGDQRYAAAGFDHLHRVATESDADEEAKVTIETLNSLGKPAGGFQICYLPAEWADLDREPYNFPLPSDSSEKLPKGSWTFWSRVFTDHKKVGPRTTKKIDRDQTLSIGTPSQ